MAEEKKYNRKHANELDGKTWLRYSVSVRDYGEASADLGKIQNYEKFLLELRKIFEQVYNVMKPNSYCCVIVMDLRKKNRFYPYHIDISQFMQEVGFIFDDLIIWNRGQEYNNLRPLGYPSVFRVNKVHEFILIFGFVHHPNRPTDLVFVECKNTKLTLAHLSQLLGYSRITRPLYSFLISPVGFSRSLVSLLQEYHRHDVLEYHSEAGKLPRQVIVAQWEMTGRHLDRNAMIGGAGL